jgi:hypothetical protein
MIDYSEKGREKFHEEWVEFADKIIGNKKDIYPGELNLIKSHINNLRMYLSGYKSYKEQMQILLKIKKNFLMTKYYEKETLGTTTNETNKLEEIIKKKYDFMNKMSSTFEEEFNQLIKNDKSIWEIHIDPN